MEKIGRYDILRKLGRGGMGSVYKAVVPVINKVVAVKVLDPFETLEALLGYDRLREIFTFEAVTMAGLHHPGVVDVWDFGEDEQGRPFFVMEFFCNNLGNMIGESFQMEQACRRINPDKVLNYGRQILEGLSCLHHNQIIHRDIKPFNILITDEDRAKICDFGMALAKGLSFSEPKKMQIGSPFYAAPEQGSRPDKVDGRADLYSVGVLLYRMLTGELPSMRSFSLSRVNPLYDNAWDDFFAKALSWHPDSRFQAADEMADGLKQLQVHWKSVSSQHDSGNRSEEEDERIFLRKEPENVCGKKARILFGLSDMHRPKKPISNRFVSREKGTIHDEATGLFWQHGCSRYSLSWQSARDYVSSLNSRAFAGKNNWRLPTVNELVSLLREEAWKSEENPFPDRGKWLWSCDRHGDRDAWYVNMDMGFADWQDITCRNFARAVSD